MGSGPGLSSAPGQTLSAFCVQLFKNLLTIPVLGGLVKLLSRVRLFATPRTVAPPGSSVWRFSRQEYWSGLPFSSLGDLPSPGIEPGSPSLQAGSLPSEPLCGLNGDKKQESGIATLVCLLNMDFLSS